MRLSFIQPKEVRRPGTLSWCVIRFHVVLTVLKIISMAHSSPSVVAICAITLRTFIDFLCIPFNLTRQTNSVYERLEIKI